MMKRIAFLGLFLALSTPLGAQTRVDSAGHAYVLPSATKGGFISKDAYVEAVRRCDRKVIRVDCAELVEAATRFIPGGHQYESLETLASYMSSLVVRECKIGPVLMSRIRFGKAEPWARPLRAGEQCLYDTNLGKDVFSLSCGNIITGVANPVPAVAEAPKQVVPQRLNLAPDTTKVVVSESPSPQPVVAPVVPAPVTPTKVQAGPTKENAQVGASAENPVRVIGVMSIVDMPSTHWSRNWGKYLVTTAVLVTAGHFICENNNCYKRPKDVTNIYLSPR